MEPALVGGAGIASYFSTGDVFQEDKMHPAERVVGRDVRFGVLQLFRFQVGVNYVCSRMASRGWMRILVEEVSFASTSALGEFALSSRYIGYEETLRGRPFIFVKGGFVGWHILCVPSYLLASRSLCSNCKTLLCILCYSMLPQLILPMIMIERRRRIGYVDMVG